MAFDVGNAVGKIIIDSKGVVDGVNQAKGAFGTLEKAAGAAMKGLAIAVVAGATAVAGLAVAAGKAAMNMEQAMADIAAVMGKTKDEVKPLKDLIQDLAVNPNLKVTAVEAADAVAMLARNGLDMTQIMEGAAEATVFLANATGGTFAQSADIMTDAMAIFGIEANNAIDAVNGITSVTTNSKFSIDDYAMALAMGGGAASAAGVEFGDFNTAIAAISPLFASGSDAGTSFKVMMQRLVPASSTAADAMRELGIITADGANQFFDADGNLRSMAEIVGVLEGAFGGLTEQQQNQALTTIFGTDAMRAAVGLMDTGKVSFEALAATMAQTDAMDAAATRMDTLAGVIEIIKSLVEGFTLQIGEALLPFLRQLADQLLVIAETYGPMVVAFFTQLVSILTSGAEPAELFKNIMALLGETFGLTQEQVNNIVTAITTFVTVVTTALGVINTIVEALGGWTTVIIAVVAALGTFAIITTVVGWVTSLIAMVGTLSTAITAAGSVIGGIIAILGGPLTVAIVAITAIVGVLALAWQNNWLGIQEKTQTAIEFVKTVINQGLSDIRSWWDEHGEAVKTIISAFWEYTNRVFGEAFSVLAMAATSALDGIKQFWQEHGDGVLEIIGILWDLLKELFENGGEIITGIIEALAALINGDWEKMKDDLTGVAEAIWDDIVAIFTAAILLVATVIAEIVQAVKSPFEEFDWASIGNWIIDGMVGALQDGAGRLAQAAWDAAKAAWDKATSFWETGSPSKKAYDLYTWVTEGSVNALVDGTPSLVGAMAGMGDAAIGAAKSILGADLSSNVFYDLFSWVPEGAALGISDNVGVLLDAMSDLGSSAAAAGAEAFGKVAAALSGIGDVLNVFAQLDAFRNSGVRVQDTVNYFAWFKNRILELMQHMAAAANIFAGNEEVVQQYSRSVSAVADAITKSTESFDALWAFRQGETRVQETVNYFAWFKNRILALMQHMAAAAAIFAGNEEVTQKYAESVGKVADSLIATAKLIAALGQMEPAPDIQQRIKIIVAIVQEMAAQFAAITVIPTTENAVSWIVGAVDNLMVIIQKLRDLASADVPGSIGEIVNAIIAQMSALPTAFNNIGVAAADSLINALLSAVPFLQQLSASIGAMIASDVAAAIVANQAVVAEAVTVVAGGGGYFPGGGGDTINSTSVNMFGGQSFGATSSPSNVINDITRLR